MDILKQELDALPEPAQRLRAAGRPMRLEELFPGADNATVREQFAAGKRVSYNSGRSDRREMSAIQDADGYVVGMAMVSRQSERSFDLVKLFKDFEAASDKREQMIPVLYRVYQGEGMLNNAINKLAGLVSHEGRLYVKHAKRGKRKQQVVKEELSRGLDFWLTHLNARASDAPITGARGATAVMEQGTRQALIEGSFIGYGYDHQVNIPSIGKTWTLPMHVQSISSQFIEVPDWSSGSGLEQFYWKPPRSLVNKIRSTKEPEQRKVLEQAFPKDALATLAKEGKLLLDPQRVMHVKHRGVDFEPFGESFLGPVMSDIAYKRALQQLDFVTIDSLVNRIVIIKVGSDDPDSPYHALETAQMRLQVLEQVMGEPGPNMQILWAGPDIDIVEVGAHNKVLEIDGRHEIAVERMLLSMGVPRALLDGGDASGQVWAGYEGLRETLRAMVNNWANCWTTMGERVAANNGYEDVELVYTPVRSVLADQTAGANLALNARRTGVYSLRRTIGELGGNFDAERRNRLLEKGYDPDGDPSALPTDEEIFMPPAGQPGDTRSLDPDGNVKKPGEPAGRPPNEETTNTDRERELENRNPRDSK
jgi:hypothetical protein